MKESETKEVLWQKHIFLYLTDKSIGLGIPQVKIAEKLLDLACKDQSPASKLNRLLKQEGPGFDGLDSTAIYEDLIEPKINEKYCGNYKKALKNFREFLDTKNIEFSPNSDWDYQEAIMAMLDEGLPQDKKPAKRSKTPTSRKPQVQPSVPALKSQNFNSLDHFTGREDILERMEGLLQREKTVVLSGIGGIGKTSLANEYVKRHSGEYNVKQRVTFSGQIDSFEQMILNLKFMHLDERNMEEAARCDKRKKLLKEMDSSVLMLLDNIDQWPQDYMLFDELRRDSDIHIIITTRLKDRFNGKWIIPVDALDGKDQMKLFEEHLQAEVDEDEVAIVRQILDSVEGHTLLIELIGKQIYNGSLDYQEVLTNLQRGMLEDSSIPVHIEKDDYNNTGQIGWFVRNILFGMERLTDEHRETLRYVVMLPAEGISRKLFLRLAPSAVNSLLQLEGGGWITRTKDQIRLHSVIRQTVQVELKPSWGNCRPFLRNLREMFTKDIQKDSEDLCKLILSIVQTLDITKSPNQDDIDFLFESAEFYRRFNEYDYRTMLNFYLLLEDSLRKSCASSVNQLHNDRLADVYLNAGWCNQQMAHYVDAVNYFKTAVDVAPEGSIQQARAYRNLGEISRKDSHYCEALDSFQKALDLFQDDFDIAEVKKSMGVVYVNLDNLPKAEQLYLQACQIFKRLLSEKPFDRLYQELAYTYHNIGTVRNKMHDLRGAKELHEKALRIRQNNEYSGHQRDIAASHTWLANDCMALGQDCGERGEAKKAEEYFKEAKIHIDTALAIRKKLLGKDHPEYAWALTTLSSWYEITGDISQALEIMKRVVSIRKNILGDEHEYTKKALSKYNELQKEMSTGSPTS